MYSCIFHSYRCGIRETPPVSRCCYDIGMKTIFFDIDGTLIDVMRGLNDPSRNTVEAFKVLQKKHRTIIASGRSYGMLPETIKELQPSGYLLMNGSYFELDGKQLFSFAIEEKAVQDVVLFFEAYEGIYFLETQSEVIFANRIGSKLFQSMMDGFEDHSVYLPFEERKDEAINMISVYFEKWETGRAFVKRFGNVFDIAQQFPRLPYYDCNIPGINKGTAIRKYLEIEKIDKDDTYAFGDSENDLQMMDVTGTSVAMGNAIGKVKDRADVITEDVLEDGVFRALLRFGLVK